MALAIRCVWCDKPLLDVEHAKKHVAEQCDVAPWRKQIAELQEKLKHSAYAAVVEKLCLEQEKNARLAELLRTTDTLEELEEKRLRAEAENTRLLSVVRNIAEYGESIVADTLAASRGRPPPGVGRISPEAAAIVETVLRKVIVDARAALASDKPACKLPKEGERAPDAG